MKKTKNEYGNTFKEVVNEIINEVDKQEESELIEKIKEVRRIVNEIDKIADVTNDIESILESITEHNNLVSVARGNRFFIAKDIDNKVTVHIDSNNYDKFVLQVLTDMKRTNDKSIKDLQTKFKEIV